MQDDKNLVILCATLIVIAAMWTLQGADAATIANSGLTGLFGVAVGKSAGDRAIHGRRLRRQGCDKRPDPPCPGVL